MPPPAYNLSKLSHANTSGNTVCVEHFLSYSKCIKCLPPPSSDEPSEPLSRRNSLSQTNRATHLCKCNGVADGADLKHAHPVCRQNVNVVQCSITFFFIFAVLVV